MSLFRTILFGVLLLGLVNCAKHEVMQAQLKPIHSFSGRILVMDISHRFQLELDWNGDEKQGELKLTHGLSGRIVNVQWLGQNILWHDNESALAWQPLSAEALSDMGVILPPWALARIFLADLPVSMHSKDGSTWQGLMDGQALKIVWGDQQQRVSISDTRKGRKVVVIFYD